MPIERSLHIEWVVPMTPVYERLYGRIADVARLGDGILAVDGWDLVLLDPEGAPRWRRSFDNGLSGTPVGVRADLAVCAGNENVLHVIDEHGRSIRETPLSAGVATPLLASHDGDVYCGIGRGECVLVHVDARGRTVFEVELARDDGLRHGLAHASDGAIWVPTDRGLFRVDGRTGAIIAHSDPGGMACISNVLARPKGAMVAAFGHDDVHRLITIADDGSAEHAIVLPPLQRAELHAAPDGGSWLVGSTVASTDPPAPDDRVTVWRLTADGRVIAKTDAAPARAIFGAPFGDSLWVGGYTYEDDLDQGMLQLFDDACRPRVTWTPDPRAGVGAPMRWSEDRFVVATSTGVVAFRRPGG